MIAIAREFSPRIQRFGSGCVVLDVSGLERLFGTPYAIGVELCRASALQLEPAAKPPGSRAVTPGPRYRGIYAHPREHAALCFDRFHPDDLSIREEQEEIREIRVNPHPVEETSVNPRPVDGISGSVAPTQIAALLMARAHPGFSVVTADVASALAAFPVQVLQQWLAEIHGVTFLRGKATRPSGSRRTPGKAWPSWEACEDAFDVLHRWGVRTLGEFAALPADELSARMGQESLALQQLACGIDSHPLVPDPDVPRFLERMELEWPVDGLEPLSFVLARLLDPLSLALERADRGAASIRLDLRLVDRSVHQRVLQLPAAMRDARVLRTLLLLDLESHPPPAAIDIVTLEVDPAPGRILQYSLLERATPSAETVATLSARLDALVGASRCGAPMLIDTHRPDAFEMRAFQVPGSGFQVPGSGFQVPGSGFQVPGSGFQVPGSGFQVPGSGFQVPGSRFQVQGSAPVAAVVLRRFRPPVAVRVTVGRGRPVRIVIDRRGMPGGDVVQAAGPWRSSGAWWERGATHWDRDEWDVALSDGAICRLYRERATDRWYLEGLLD